MAEYIAEQVLASSEWAEVHRSVQEVEEKVGRTFDIWKRSGIGYTFRVHCRAPDFTFA